MSGRPPRSPRPGSTSRAPRVLAALEAPALACVPLALGACAYFQVEQAALLTVIVALAAVGVFFAGFEASRPALRQIMPTVVLAALAAAGRVLFAPIPDFKPVSAICILAGAVFGRRSGFLVGALAALVSNFFFGQGPWTPWQMYAWGLVGYLAGVLADRGWLDRLPVLVAYGFLSGPLYGLLLNGWYVIGFVHPLTWPAALVAFGIALPFDTLHGAATVAFLLALYAPWRRKLERIKRKYALADGRGPAEGGRARATMLRDRMEGGAPMAMNESALREAAAVLRRGEAALFPTDTVYGLGVAVDFAEGPGTLYDLKERDSGKPIAWLVGTPDDLVRYGEDVPASALALARRFWPGPLTLVVRAAERVPAAFRSSAGTIGLRMPDDPTALALIEAVGCPLATTSANLSGNKAPRSFDELDPALSARVFAVGAPDDPGGSGLASTVLDCTGGFPLVVRQGAVALEDIRPLL